MKKSATLLLCSIVGIYSASALSDSVNPFNYSKHEDAILEAKWQLGNSGDSNKDVCKNSACESALNSSSYDDYIYADDDSSYMFFSTDGSQAAFWRSELRYEDNFEKSDTISMSARVGFYGWNSSSSSEGFTVAQLHMEGANGPPVRLEYMDRDHMAVTFRTSPSCTSNCWKTVEFNTTAAGWKNIVLQLKDEWVNVSVNGETKSYQLSSSWPDDGAYYWKAGIYLQKSGQALVGFDYINW